MQSVSGLIESRPVNIAPTHPQSGGIFKSGDTAYSRIKFPVNIIQSITQITILNALLTAWEGDLWGRDIMSGDESYYRLKKIVYKNFSSVLKNVKSFS